FRPGRAVPVVDEITPPLDGGQGWPCHLLAARGRLFAHRQRRRTMFVLPSWSRRQRQKHVLEHVQGHAGRLWLSSGPRTAHVEDTRSTPNGARGPVRQALRLHNRNGRGKANG